MNLKIEIERAADGRWLAEVPDLPGCLAYGQTQVEALANARGLPMRVMSNRLQPIESVSAGAEFDLAEDSAELAAELLQAADGPFTPFHPQDLQVIADRALRDHRARQS